MNKLLFKLERDFIEDIILISNNHKDLEDYLRNNYDWYSIDVNEHHVIIKEHSSYESEIADLKWVKQV